MSSRGTRDAEARGDGYRPDRAERESPTCPSPDGVELGASDRRGLSRRRLLQEAAALTIAAASTPATARAARRRGAGRRSVAIFGGGMAGLAAAHELIERGFKVTVYEPTALGGKARSIPVPGSGRDGRNDLPGEHGFRFFPGFYHHVPDSMRRIPFAGNANGVWDNLEEATLAVLSFAGSEDVIVPFGFTERTPAALTPQALTESLVGGLKLGSRVPPHELAIFVERLWVFLTSCDERRYGQWEHVPWMTFIQAEGKSAAYRDLLARGLTRALVAAKEEVASARTIGNMAEAFLMNGMNRGNDGAPDRVLTLPTNEAWIDPWVGYLRDRGVVFRSGWGVTALRTRAGRIAAALIERRGVRREVQADWFLCALPVERMVGLLSDRLLALDPRLEGMHSLSVDWMVGIQYFLTRDAPLVDGHMAYMDSPWAVTSINQAQYWHARQLPRDYGDGTVKDILSVDVSDWDTPGRLTGRPAKRCNPEEVAREVWEQITASVNDVHPGRLRDEDLHSWFMDPAVAWWPESGRNTNATPLLVNTVGSWERRPAATTAIPNLFLAGDHVQTNIDLATMEGANESARAAVNGILDASGSNAERAALFRLYQPPELEAAKRLDRERWRAGQPNAFDIT